MGKLQDRVAVVTGGGSGIGEASGLVFAEEGAIVAVADVNLAHAERTAAQIEAAGGRAQALHCDVASWDSCEQLVATVAERHGRIDVLFNNAGTPSPVSLADLTVAEWDRTFDIYAKSIFMLTKLVAPVMKRQGGGSIVSTASDAGLVAVPGQPAYCASKGAAIALTRALALELAPEIRVNCLCPGWVRTPMMDEYYEGAYPDKAERDAVIALAEATQMIKRFGRPREIGAAALFLASDDASYVTGVALSVDGGFIAHK